MSCPSLVSGLNRLLNELGQFNSDLKLFEQELAINVVAPAAGLRAFQPLLEKGTGKRVVILSTEMGSLTMSSQVPFLSAYHLAQARLGDLKLNSSSPNRRRHLLRRQSRRQHGRA